jgi:protein ImuB
MKRVISLWLPRFATDRLSRTGSHPDRAQPLATVTSIHGGQRLAAVNHAATKNGLAPGLPLADARALCPGLRVVAAAPEADLAALDRLTAACERYTPWTSADPLGGGLLASMGGAAGIWLDVTGCTHLFGGEESLLADLVERCRRAGYQARVAMADTPGAAWAFARFGGGRIVNVTGREQRAQLAPLPVAALRLDSGLIEGLDRMGLRVVGDLMRLPRAPLAHRFGRAVLERLDQALGEIEEPISPRRAPPRYAVRQVFAEPIARPEDIEAGAKILVEELCALLEIPAQGVRQMELVLHRVDNTAATVEIGTSRPIRDSAHLLHLLRDKLEDFDAEYGVEVMALMARETSVLPLTQQGFDDAIAAAQGLESARLVDRLASRLGSANVTRLEAQSSHLPERACRERPVMAPAPSAIVPWEGAVRRPSRPIKLLREPLQIDATAPLPDGPPITFTWRHQTHTVVSAEGPERIAPEWWQIDKPALTPEVRDYYKIEDQAGRRFWIYRAGLYTMSAFPLWYIHGFFA